MVRNVLRGLNPAIAAALLASTAAHGAGPDAVTAGVAARILALPGGGTDAWDVAVRAELLAYDGDGSGSLDRPMEVAVVPCEVWRAVDAGVRGGFGVGVFTVYGFAPDKLWVGEALGVPVSLRGLAAAALSTCGLGPEQPLPAREIDVAHHIRRLPGGGSAAWDSGVRTLLVHAYDEDESGIVDGDDEVAAVPCAAWRAIDDGVREGWPAGVYVTYGLDGALMWIGDALGLAERTRPAVVQALRDCQVPGAQTTTVLPRDADVIARVVSRLPEAGGGPWSEVVRRSLLFAFDGDGDGLLDERAELAAVPCSLWRALDASVRGELGQGLGRAYGFHPDAPWRGYALGIPGASRAVAQDVLGACGLGAAPDVGVAVPSLATSSTPLPEPLRAFDADLSGWLDSTDEVRAVSCSDWHILDAQTRAARGVGAVAWFGLRPRSGWTGDTLGITQDQSRLTARRVRACLGPRAR